MQRHPTTSRPRMSNNRLLALFVLVAAVAMFSMSTVAVTAKDLAAAAAHAPPQDRDLADAAAAAAAADDDLDVMPEVPECPRHFTRDLQRVCASNGRVYDNLSVLAYHQCRAAVFGRPAITQKDMAFCTGRREL